MSAAETPSTDTSATRRIRLTLRRPLLALYPPVKPTIVLGGRGQPAQWGEGTWQVPAGQTVTIGVYLFNRVWRFGQAEIALNPGDAPALEYRAPVLPFLSGRMLPAAE